MNKLLSLAVLCSTFISCNGNIGVNKQQTNRAQEDSSENRNKKPVYVSIKRAYKYDGIWKDTLVKVGGVKVTVSMEMTCQNDYAVRDTSCADDTCWINLFRETTLHIKVASPRENTVVIDKALLKNNYKHVNFSNGMIDNTSIDSINNVTKEIIFTTYIDFNGSTMSIQYSIGLDGKLTLLDKDMMSNEY